MDTWDHGGDYRERILGDAKIREVLTEEEVDRAFSMEEAMKHVDAIFERSLAASDALDQDETEEKS
jgi:hypothetical protein